MTSAKPTADEVRRLYWAWREIAESYDEALRSQYGRDATYMRSRFSRLPKAIRTIGDATHVAGRAYMAARDAYGTIGLPS